MFSSTLCKIELVKSMSMPLMLLLCLLCNATQVFRVNRDDRTTQCLVYQKCCG